VGVVVGAGAVAGAIGAILALVPGPAPPLRANLGDVRVGPQLTLADWAIRAAPGTALAPSGATASRLAAEVMVQAGDETTSVGPTGPSGGPVIQPRRLSEEDTKALNDGLTLALSNPDASLTETDLGSACADDVARPECGLRSTATYLLEAHSPPTPESVENHFLTLFDGIRIPPTVGQPVGVPVDVEFSSTDLSGHTATISWTLYRDHGLAPVPEDWIRGESVLTVSGNVGQRSEEFWVPSPMEAGPYYVQVNVFDEDGNRLDSAKGKPDFGYGGTTVARDAVGGIQLAPLDIAGGFTLYTPSWTPPAVTGESLRSGGTLTALVSPDRNMIVAVQQAPEEPLQQVANEARNERAAEPATHIARFEATTIEGRDTYLLQYSHNEQPNDPNLPDLGEAYVSTYFFNDSSSSWRVRAAVKTSVSGGEKLALDLATKMAETFEPKP
jgi:hypothetical protein